MGWGLGDCAKVKSKEEDQLNRTRYSASLNIIFIQYKKSCLEYIPDNNDLSE